MNTKKHKVFITRRIPETGLNLLRKACDVEVYNGEDGISYQLLLEKLKDIEGIITLLSDKIDKNALSQASKLRVVSNYAVGYDNIDVPYATSRGILVTNTPGVLTDATADLSWALLMAVARRIVEGDRLMREKKFNGWSPLLLLGQDLKGKTLGILGAGRIGTAVAERSVGWKMIILYYDRNQNLYLEKTLSAHRASFTELIQQSDFISIHLPLTAETKHLINEQVLQQMKKSAILINTARGAVIDENALVKALENHWIAGAGLDVFENEPEVAPGLERLTNVVLAPHIGSATIQARQEMAKMAAINLIDALEGRLPKFTINPEAFKGTSINK